jgi:hypothetical protein
VDLTLSGSRQTSANELFLCGSPIFKRWVKLKASWIATDELSELRELLVEHHREGGSTRLRAERRIRYVDEWIAEAGRIEQLLWSGRTAFEVLAYSSGTRLLTDAALLRPSKDGDESAIPRLLHLGLLHQMGKKFVLTPRGYAFRCSASRVLLSRAISVESEGRDSQARAKVEIEIRHLVNGYAAAKSQIVTVGALTFPTEPGDWKASLPTILMVAVLPPKRFSWDGFTVDRKWSRITLEHATKPLVHKLGRLAWEFLEAPNRDACGEVITVALSEASLEPAKSLGRLIDVDRYASHD